jgi:hypothetical protein
MFAVVMVVYGISLIFAATKPVIFSMSPSSQTVPQNTSKTITIRLDPNGNTVRGGSLKISYDASRLTFVKSAANSNLGPYGLYSEDTSKAGQYSISFFTYYNTTQAINFGTLEFKAKPLTGNATTTLSFTAANTYAYQTSSSHYSSQLTGATMTIQGSVVSKPAVTLSANPASVVYKGSTTLTWSATNSPTSCTNNFGGPASATGSFKASSLTATKTFTVTCTNAGGSGSGSKTVAVAAKPGDPAPPVVATPATPSGGTSSGGGATQTATGNSPTSETAAPAGQTTGQTESTDFEPGDAATTTTHAKKPFPLRAVASIMAGMGLLALCVVAFLKLRRNHGLKPATNIHGNLFGGAAAGALTGAWPKTEEAEQDEVSVYGQGPEADQPTDGPEAPMPNQEFTAEQEQVDQPSSEAQPPVPATETLPEESVANPEPVPQPQAPAETSAIEQPVVSPAELVAQATLANLAAHKKPTIQEVMAKEPILPDPPEPQWQKELEAEKAAAHADEPKDMFELANEDPETFGSTQLAETYGDETDHKGDGNEKA